MVGNNLSFHICIHPTISTLKCSLLVFFITVFFLAKHNHSPWPMAIVWIPASSSKIYTFASYCQACKQFLWVLWQGETAYRNLEVPKDKDESRYTIPSEGHAALRESKWLPLFFINTSPVGVLGSFCASILCIGNGKYDCTTVCLTGVRNRKVGSLVCFKESHLEEEKGLGWGAYAL